MRVITGSAKGHHLKGPKGTGTRPMLDSVKESLFSILTGYGALQGKVLDLYAGTGSIGIEALSRGMAWADFVEQKAAECEVVKENLTHTKLILKAKVYQQPVARFLQQHKTGERYDLIMMDPPYADPQIHDTVSLVIDADILVPGGIFIIGHSIHVEFDGQYGKYSRCDFRQFGGSCFTLYTTPDTEGAEA
ncbi:MAG: 16S rRNA (guanine(966)-N(2))-methyltransferase RsmD [Chloroflexales bacterium]|nr:16S rRNA (guanine(966)-N(2))-methyltransferase RsmD [Chloroflexales bacterium]